MEEDLTFTMNMDGQDVTCTVLFTFSSEQTGANYMLYTKDKTDGSEEVHIMAGRFDPENMTAIYPLQDDTDRAIVQSFLSYVTEHEVADLKRELEEADDGIFSVDDLPS